MEKTFEELQISDDFMFSVIMRNPKFCKPFLERILNIKISRIEYPKSQETIDITADAKSVRLDIYVEDGKEPEDDYTRELDEAVQSVRRNEKWRALNVRWTFVKRGPKRSGERLYDIADEISREI